MTPQHRIGKISEQETNEMAAESYRQITGREPMTPQPLFTITELEMRQIQQDCAYPNSESCDGCPFADGEDTTRASGLGCNFIGANRLIDEIMERSRPAPLTHDDTGNCLIICQHCGKVTQVQCKEAAQARKDVLEKLRKWSIVQYEISGVIDTMTLKQKIESLRTEGGDE